MSATLLAKPFTGRVQGFTAAKTSRVSRAARVAVRAEKDQVCINLHYIVSWKEYRSVRFPSCYRGTSGSTLLACDARWHQIRGVSKAMFVSTEQL